MSHFAVIVVTTNRPTDENGLLDEQLQRFHEFECTGTDDQYIQDIDQTQQLREEYETAKADRLRDPAGGLHEPWADRFYRDPTPDELQQHRPFGTGGNGKISWASKDWGDGRGYRPKVHFVPDGWQEVEVPRREVESFAEFVAGYHGTEIVPFGEKPDLAKKHKYGYALTDAKGVIVKVVRRTNPAKKWDWWTVGGRYSGRLWPKGRKADDGVDSCRVSDLDRDQMKAVAVDRRRNELEDVCDKGKMEWSQLDAAFAEYHPARAEWLAMPEPRPRGREYYDWLDAKGLRLAGKLNRGAFDVPEVKPGQTVAEWCLAAPWLSTFAFLRDGQWAERGEMGWWGTVHNESDDWPEALQRLLVDVPDDHWLTVVDCHI